MKNMFKTMTAWATVAIGVNIGNWLWDNVVKEKACDLKDSIAKRFSKEEEDEA